MKEILFQKYELIRSLGQGGTGKVYLARDIHLNRLAAVKESKEQFLHSETELLKALEHPGIPKIYDCFRIGDKTYLVMEYIEGMTLRQYLQKHGSVPERQAVKWAVEITGILGYLHSRRPKVIYRDLKPENVMIRQDGTLKLIDLGGACGCNWGISDEKLCMGTVGYSPAEQWKETGGDVTWDIYAIGVLLHEMLTGANPTLPPYERRPLREYDKSLSGSLDKIIKICTDKNSLKRYQSMEQLENSLLHYNRPLSLSKGWWLSGKVLVTASALYTAICFLSPLLQGIPQNQIPFPYLEKPLIWLMFTLLIYLLFFGSRNKKGYMIKQEKNIWLTEKQFSGLVTLLIFMLGAGFTVPAFQMTAPEAYAGAAGEKLWVEMRDSRGRKMLLKDDAIYKPDTAVRFELPSDRLPSQELSLQLVAVGEDGSIYSSRIFRISSKDKATPSDTREDLN